MNGCSTTTKYQLQRAENQHMYGTSQITKGNSNGMFFILDDLKLKQFDEMKAIEALQSTVAEHSDENKYKKKLQTKIKELAENNEIRAKIVNKIMEYLNLYEGTTMDAEHYKCSQKGPSAKNRKVAVQLYCSQNTDMTDYIMKALEAMLIRNQFHHQMKLTVQTHKELSNVQRDVPIILVCLNSSRLDVDYRDAISEIPDRFNTALLICHLLEEHNLPTVPSKTLLPKAEVMKVGTIIDMAFLDDTGFYDCRMNENGCTELLTFIESHWYKSSAEGSKRMDLELPARKPSTPPARRPSLPQKAPASPPLLSKPWRVSRPLNSEKLLILKTRVENYSLPSYLKVTQARILMLGPVGAGKFSFFNTINSIFPGRITQENLDRSATGSLTIMNQDDKAHSLKTERPLNFCLISTGGLDQKTSGADNLDYLLEGNVTDRYKFSSTASIFPDIKGFRHTTELQDTVHCVIFLLDASLVKATNQDIWEKFNQVQDRMISKGIPSVILITKIDKLLKPSDIDVSKLFFSKDVERAARYASEKLRVPLGDVMPILNYENGDELQIEISCLALQALDRMLGYANEYLMNQHHLMKLSLKTTA